MLNICMVGHGMMGVWHSEALRRVDDARLHTVVGRPASLPANRPRRPPWATSRRPPRRSRKSTDTRNGPPTSVKRCRIPRSMCVIIAGPSETHAEMALASLEHGKHTLVEIPIAMNLDGAERVVAAAKERA